MKKTLLLLFLTILSFSNLLTAQVKVNQNAANSAINTSSAFMDASSSPLWNGTTNQGKGILYPRVDLVNFTAMSHAGPFNASNNPNYFDGLLVFNTATGVAGIGADSVFPGYYYYRNTTTTANGGHWVSLKGIKGDDGSIGPIGPQGVQGIAGNDGLIGATGAQGPTGVAGTNGTIGSTGATGAQGPTGFAGPNGSTGSTGATGATGLLSSGTLTGNTPYWDGSQWVLNNSNIHNNGAGVGIGTTSPNASAKVEITSTTQGFLPPRMTTVQRDAIPSPAAGLTIYNTTVNCLQWWNGTSWYDGCGNNVPSAVLSTLNCVGATTTGVLAIGTAASGVLTTVSYTGGNGGTYAAQAVSSTGVLGLTANLSAGTLAFASGNLVYTITGTPTASGTASFAISIGGQTCTLNITVGLAIGTFAVGTVNCAGATAVVDVTSPTGKIWMDRNLGASQVATSSTDAASYGDLYQWGRRADGHQCRTSATTATLSSIDQPANGNFILASTDWRSPQNVNLWQGVNGVNNPCPSGYRIPTEPELEAERLSWSVASSVGAFASPLKLTRAGYRSSNSLLVNVGIAGLYWSSAVSGTFSYSLSFISSTSAGMVAEPRVYGFSVRCIKE